MAGFEITRCVLRMFASICVAASVTGCRNGHAASEAAGIEVQATRPRYVETRELVTHLAENLLVAHEVTGVSLALVDGDEVVWATGFGYANAVERGELSLDQTLAQLLPELELADGAEQKITLEQLISHQSGLPSDWFIHDLSEFPPPWTAIVAEIQGLALAQPPGEQTLYSNLGMTLAGAALERAAGRPCEDVVTKTLLRPAGMRTAYFPGGPEPVPVLLPIADGPRGLEAVEQAAAYRQHELRHDPAFRMNPAGGLRASVLDLAAFASLILREGEVGTRPLLAPESVAAMLTAHNDALEIDLDHQNGYGWFLDHRKLGWVGRVAWHGGRTYYHTGQLEHPPLPIVMVLDPLDDRRARIAGRGRGQGTIIEVRGEPDDERLWWAGREFRREP